MRTKLISAAIGAVTALLLAGCGADDPQPAQGTAAADRNDADIRFATEMIPHHSQAVDMAELAPTRAGSAEVKDLAQRIQAAQDPEIQLMTTWLGEWGAPTPGSGDHGHSSDDAGAEAMPGMMTDEQMTALEQSSGAEFDRLFLDMMIEHHEGAITMSEQELREGANAEAKALATEIIKAQQAEITEMRELLAQG